MALLLRADAGVVFFLLPWEQVLLRLRALFLVDSPSLLFDLDFTRLTLLGRVASNVSFS